MGGNQMLDKITINGDRVFTQQEHNPQRFETIKHPL